MNYVYIVECRDGSLYTGWTNNLQKRIICHNRGKGAKYTRGRLPVVLKYAEEFSNSNDARKRESFIKSLSRRDKLLIIESGDRKQR